MVDPIQSGNVPSTPKPVTAAPVQASSQPAVRQTSQQPLQAPAQQPPQPLAQDKVVPRQADTIEISNAAQARSLRQQGVSVPEIALQLRLDVQTVNGFFPKNS
jgi:hypothetical protein